MTSASSSAESPSPKEKSGCSTRSPSGVSSWTSSGPPSRCWLGPNTSARSGPKPALSSVGLTCDSSLVTGCRGVSADRVGVCARLDQLVTGTTPRGSPDYRGDVTRSESGGRPDPAWPGRREPVPVARLDPMSGIQRRPLRGPRGARRRLLGVPLLAGLAVLAMLVPLAVSHDPTAGAAVDRDVPGPLLFSRGFADPTVVESRVGLVGAATALDLTIGRAPADTGPWSVAPTPALTRRPGWATSVDIWAPDIQRAPGGWLMYFAAGISGADESSRCIGVAHAKAAYGPYTPVGNAPLVCPVVPGVPRAGDRPPNRVRGE